MDFKQPLEIYIVWQSDFLEGKALAGKLYNLFCRNVEFPFDASIGIPVYYRYEKTESGQPIAIDTGEAKRCVVIVLINDDYILDKELQDYVDELIDIEHKQKNVRVFPISFTQYFSKCRPTITAKNVVRVHDAKLLASLSQDENGLLKTSLLHEVARFLMNLESVASEKTGSSAPIRLFISHSKHDSTVKEAIDFKAFVDGKSQLKTFFDVNDLEYGSDFEIELNKGIGESALVVFQSDSYSSREWCRIEAITAKRNNCPVIVVNAIETGEKRSFPYLGNVPTIRLNRVNENYRDIIDLTLERVIHNLYKKELMGEIANLYKLDIDYKTSSLPELFDILKIKKLMQKKGDTFSVVLYPDPPLGSEEMAILNDMNDDLFFITPNQLSTLEKIQDGK